MASKLRRKVSNKEGTLYDADPNEYIMKRSNSLLDKRGYKYSGRMSNPELEIPPPNKKPLIFKKDVIKRKPISPNTQKQRKERQRRISTQDMGEDQWRLKRADSAIKRLSKRDIKKKKTSKSKQEEEKIKRENLRGTHYEIEYDDDGKPQYIQMSPQYIEETDELLQIPMPAQDRNSRNEEARLLFEKVDKELRRRGGRTRKRRRRRRKGGQTKTVQFSECLSDKECDAPKICYKTASGWNLPKELLGTCVDLTKFDKEQPSIKVNPGKLVNNPLRQHPEIGIPHGSDLLDRYGGKKIGLWGNRIKKSMKRLKRKRRKTRKRKRKKSRKKRRRRRRRKTRR